MPPPPGPVRPNVPTKAPVTKPRPPEPAGPARRQAGAARRPPADAHHSASQCQRRVKTNPLTRDPPPPWRGQARGGSGPRRLRPEEAAGPVGQATDGGLALEPQPGIEDETGTGEEARPAEPPEVQNEASGGAAGETQPVPDDGRGRDRGPGPNRGRNPAGARDGRGRDRGPGPNRGRNPDRCPRRTLAPPVPMRLCRLARSPQGPVHHE